MAKLLPARTGPLWASMTPDASLTVPCVTEGGVLTLILAAATLASARELRGLSFDVHTKERVLPESDHP